MNLAAAMEVEENHGENSLTQSILIEDVLSKIFEFLPCRDRKNAKLVCKLWLQVLRHKHFVQKEAFFFPHFYCYATVMKVVDDCYQNRLMNLKFELRQFPQNSQIFWRKCGSKIESLHFSKCSFYSDMLLHVFTYCVNLKHLRLEECGTSSHPNCALIKDLIFPKESQNFVHENLSFLDLYVGIPLNLNDLLFVASAFPKLKTLKVALACNSEVTFSALVQILQTRFSPLDTLCVKFSFEDDISLPKDFSNLSLSNFKGSKNVSFSLFAPRMNSVENIKTILSYKCWTALTIYSFTLLEMTLNSDVIHMLEQNRFLEELEIDFTFNDVLEFCAIFAALVKSSLKYLHLSINKYSDVDEHEHDHILLEADSLLKNLSKNYTLLHLGFNTNVQKLGSLFLKYFPNVRDLGSDSVMNINTILEHQKNLKSLTIYPGINTHLEDVFPKSSMRSVEFLEIKHVVVLVEALFNFQFPNLLYLTFEDDLSFRKSSIRTNIQNSFEEMPKWFPQKFPNLRGIEIRWFNESPNLEELIVFSRSFQNLYQLRYISLYILSANNSLEAHWKNIVSSYLFRCPSLKAVWITNGKFRHYYYYDVLRKEFRPFSQCNVFYFSSYNDCVNFKSYWRNDR